MITVNVVYWKDGCIHADGREFADNRETDQTAYEAALEFLTQRYSRGVALKALNSGYKPSEDR